MHLRSFTACILMLLMGCEASPPIQPAASSKSAFDGAVFKGTTARIRDPSDGTEAYRVYSKGATGFVSMSSVRTDAEDRATAFCDREGKAMESLQETTANPPYIMGNFPRIEIVFDCIPKVVGAAVTAPADPKYAKLRDLKKLLDDKVITQTEFDSEKAKILNQP